MTIEQVYAVLGALLILVLWLVVAYNRFVSQRNLIRNSWSNVDTELRRRYDLIPNLVETVRGYAAHERTVLEEVTRARAGAVAESGSPAQQQRAEEPLVDALRRLLAVAEAYPALKASEHFMRLQDELVVTEDRIQAARRFYNANVRDFNTRAQAFPSNLIASLYGFKSEEFFNIEPAVRPEVERPPQVTL